MNCLIVDDDEMSINAIKHLTHQVDYLNIVKTCSNSVEAIASLKKEKIDVIFLDIEMPEMSGIDLIKNLNTKSLIILTTSHQEYALEAFEYNIVDYLVKPVHLPRFIKAVDKAKELFDNTKNHIASSDKDYFFIKDNSVVTKVLIKDILWIEAMGDYITINTINKKFILHLTLKAIEEKIFSHKFIRVHRSYIVALANINMVQDTTICIGDKLIPVGAIYKEGFYKRLDLL